MEKSVYFISDLHLGAACHHDTRAHERMVTRWLESIAPRAEALYLLGDVMDYWYEYREVVPRGFVRFLGQLARMADAGVKITWLKGNHDIWIYDYLPAELGITVVDGILDTEIHGRRFVMEHGDGMGRQTAGFRFIRSLFRNRVAQKLFSGIHPRWTVAFAHRWSSHSRAGQTDEDRRLMSRAADALAGASQEYLATHPGVDYFLYGHLHIVDDRVIDASSGARMLLLGDWIDKFSYAVFTPGQEVKIGRYISGEDDD